MGGGLMQLVAYGAQDIYLTGSPQITFFKVVYRRHTNFSLESIEQTFNGSVGFGRKVTCTVSRNGDLLTKAYLKVTLPQLTEQTGVAGAKQQCRWCDHVGHKLINYVEVEIGGQRIDKHYGDWLQIWNELTQTAGHAIGYNRMIGHHPTFQQPIGGGSTAGPTPTPIPWVIPSQTMYIPMQFWFNRNPGLALPLIALQYHEVKFNFDFAPIADLCPGIAPVPARPGNTLVVAQGDLQASLFIDYIYLDADERKRFAQVTHEYLIEQLQFTGAESIPANGADGGSQKCKLQFNHPVKELVWTVSPNYHPTIEADRMTFEQRPFDYSLPGIPMVDPLVPNANANAIAGAGGNNAALVNILYGKKNPVKEGILQLNGHDRFSKRDGMYFNLVQPYQHHENVPATGINVYSFALKPEEHQPSGSCNMSRIDNAVLNLELEHLAAGAQVSLYATNYNVLRVLSGMGGLAYASISYTGVSNGITSIGMKMFNLIFTGFTHSFGR
jgi:Major capsid protein N-terminus/Large eukaryotic DNA virus major capsid protein